jgi:molybdopterin adenylyltransferase
LIFDLIVDGAIEDCSIERLIALRATAIVFNQQSTHQQSLDSINNQRSKINNGIALSVLQHKSEAPVAIGCFVLTVSDTRTLDTDTSGAAICDLLKVANQIVTAHVVVRDEPVDVAAQVLKGVADPATDVIITTGGTGITSRDGTYEAVDALFQKRLDGFGEIFRMLSFHEIGAAAMLSRATAGTIGSTAIFLLPGSENAVRMAMTRLILPELGHVVQQLRK